MALESLFRVATQQSESSGAANEELVAEEVVEDVAEMEMQGSVRPADLYGAASDAPSPKPNAAVSLALVGAALGIEAVAMVSVLTLCLAVLALLMRPVLNFVPGLRPQRPLPITLSSFFAAMLLLVFWDSAHRMFVGLSMW